MTTSGTTSNTASQLSLSTALLKQYDKADDPLGKRFDVNKSGGVYIVHDNQGKNDDLHFDATQGLLTYFKYDGDITDYGDDGDDAKPLSSSDITNSNDQTEAQSEIDAINAAAQKDGFIDPNGTSSNGSASTDNTGQPVTTTPGQTTVSGTNVTTPNGTVVNSGTPVATQ